MTENPVSVRLTTEERQQVRDMAKEEHRSEANMLRVLVLDGIVARRATTAATDPRRVGGR